MSERNKKDELKKEFTDPAELAKELGIPFPEQDPYEEMANDPLYHLINSRYKDMEDMNEYEFAASEGFIIDESGNWVPQDDY